jgi:flagellar biosynthesis protein FliQ
MITQVSDPAVGLAPRVACVGVALVIFGPSIGSQLEAFANRLWPLVATIGTG